VVVVVVVVQSCPYGENDISYGGYSIWTIEAYGGNQFLLEGSKWRWATRAAQI
jgi:hypothetical protein